MLALQNIGKNNNKTTVRMIAHEKLPTAVDDEVLYLPESILNRHHIAICISFKREQSCKHIYSYSLEDQKEEEIKWTQVYVK